MMPPDAIVELRNDHKQLRALFREFEGGAADGRRKGDLVKQIVELLTVHTYIENEVMYPEVRAQLPDLEQDILESFEEHHVADVLCAELWAMSPEDERFEAKTTVLMENVSHHMHEEEHDWFPKVRDGLTRKQLQALGAKIEEARAKAPHCPAQPSALKKALDAIVR